jgi:hypothetical protein
MAQDKSKRNYKKEYADYHGTADQKKDRAGRNKARKIKAASGAVKKGDGKDVDHKNRNPRDNSKKNLSVTSRKKNRGWNRKK